MWILLLGLTSGLVASSWANSVQQVKLRSCSYKGVFHIQGDDRYTLTFEDAQNLCKELGYTLASNEQVTEAHGLGFETCRYGWVSSGNITIPRHVSNDRCAKNLTGVITLVPDSTYDTFDAFCYDDKDLSNKTCEFEIKYVGNDNAHPETSEVIKQKDVMHTNADTTNSSMEVPEELPLSTTAVSVIGLTHDIEHTNSTPANTLDELGVSGDLLNLNTQPASTNLNYIFSQYTTIMSTQDTPGSGMGEPIHPINPVDTDATESSTETTKKDESVNQDQSEHPKGRMGSDVALPKDDKTNNDNKDWLVILLVVVAIIVLILFIALVVTRNRWCGKSQTLMITSKSNSDGNGTAASVASPEAQERAQEMVTLMNKEKIQENGNTEEFTVITLEESPEKNQQE